MQPNIELTEAQANLLTTRLVETLVSRGWIKLRARHDGHSRMENVKFCIMNMFDREGYIKKEEECNLT